MSKPEESRSEILRVSIGRVSVKDWALEDRPREKLMLKGASALSDSELLAILIGSGTREKSAVEVCQEILADADNDLNKLARHNVSDLTQYKGIGPANANVAKFL